MMQCVSKLRRRSDRRRESEANIKDDVHQESSLVLEGEGAGSTTTNTPRRRSVHRSSVYGNDEILDRALEK